MAMGYLLAIEGADGAGKATAAAAVARALIEGGRTATMLSFPRYTDTTGGWVLGEYLGGRIPRTVSPRAAAVLYALDRLESLATLEAAMVAHDVVVLDRYIASNMVYQASQVPLGEADALMRWIARLELDQFGLPAPDLSIHLATPATRARAQIAAKRRRSYTDDAFDAYEADEALQARVRANYAAAASAELLGRWATIDPFEHGEMLPPNTIAHAIVALLAPLR